VTRTRTRRVLVAASLLALSIRAALAATPAELHLVVFDEATPLAAVAVEVDGALVGRTNDNGALTLNLAPGTRELVLRDGARVLWRYQLSVREGENAELITTLSPHATPRVMFESSLAGSAVGTAPAAAAGPPGTLRGRIVGSEDGQPIAGARVFVSGTPIDARSDADGRFEARLPAGEYSISVVAPNFAAQTLGGIAVIADTATTRDLALTPSGLELPEFVVLEPFIEGSLAAFVEERRQSFAVADVLGIEQISRAGDSDVAGALRRVTGLTLVDGKYVYVRGLGERYSSVLLNGAPVPSPDPSRRVVPLDLFPVDILAGVLIQKSFSAEMPGEFGGGTVQLRTKGAPEAFFFKIGLSQGWAQGVTFSDGLRYDGGSQDWSGFDQLRGLPDPVIEANQRFGRIQVQTPFSPGLTPEQLTAIGVDLAAQGFDVRQARLPTNGSLSASTGNAWQLGDAWRVGFLSAMRYAQSWDNQQEVRRRFAFIGPNDPLVSVLDIERNKTERNIDLSGFLALSAEYGENHRLVATSTLVRQTIDTTQIDEGTDISESLSRFFLLEWEENALIAQQFNGEHLFPEFSNFGFDWNYTRARATRATPNTREYRYDFIEGSDNQFGFSPRSDSNSLIYGELTDDSESWFGDFKWPIEAAPGHTLTLLAGATGLARERSAEVRRYSFFGGPPAGSADDFLRRPLGQILVPGNIGPGRYVLRETTRNSDAYTAEQALNARYLTADYLWQDLLRVSLGLRDERNRQTVRTFNLTDPSIVDSAAAIDTVDKLPSLGLTWFIDADSQLRAVYAQTVSRPDFRELSTSPFIDPLIDTISIGNPNLLPAAIENFDLRYEYYFSPTETAAVALFAKEFTDPIERIQSPATGDVVTYTNVPSATLRGIEFDVYKSLGFVADWGLVTRLPLDWVPWQDVFIGANYARIQSKVSLTRATAGISTNLERPLQGQSPYVANLQVGWYPEGGDAELSLLYNVSGRRISEVGVFGIPDVFEQPYGQLDLVYAHSFADDWKFKLRLRNLLDPKSEFTVGDEIRRELRKGREAQLSIEWAP